MRKSVPYKKDKWAIAPQSTKTAIKELYRLEIKKRLTDPEKATMNGIKICNYGFSTDDLPNEIKREIETKNQIDNIPRA